MIDYPYSGRLPKNARPAKGGYWQAALDRVEAKKCPSCHSRSIKTYSDGEKECNQCHKTWDVRGSDH